MIEPSELVAASLHDVKNRLWLVEQKILGVVQENPNLEATTLEIARMSVQLSLALLIQRSTSGPLILRHDEVWLQEWIEELKASVPPSDITLDWLIHKKTAFFDRNIIAIAVRELVFNALRYAKQRICIQVFSENNCFHICVEDDGSGFVPENKSQDVYDQTLRTGLGLNLVKTVIKAHEHCGECGQLRLQEKGSLGGARLEIILP